MDRNPSKISKIYHSNNYDTNSLQFLKLISQNVLQDKRMRYINLLFKFSFLFLIILLLFYNLIGEKKNFNFQNYKKSAFSKQRNNNFKKYEHSIIKENNISNNIRVCICTLGKEENNYIQEFVDYYYKIGVDKIFLYDNNDLEGENFENVINFYINKGFVELLNWRGTKKTQYIILDDCYSKNKNNFDWILFYDIDEYIHLKNYTNIKAYLNENRFKNCQKIYLNWVIHTDNNLFYYDNRTLHERFPEVELSAKLNKKGIVHRAKIIVKGHIPNDLSWRQLASIKYKGCNGYGEEAKLINRTYMNNSDFENYYIDHYYSKSVEEFINKINKGDCYFEQKEKYKKKRIRRYFDFNEMTLKKIKLIEKNTKINLKKLYKKVKKK